MFEVYKDLKERYPKSIMLIKSGGFYECLCDDCIIINKPLFAQCTYLVYNHNIIDY